MKVSQLQLSENALNKLRQIALTIELEERKRFSVRREVDQVVELLNFAVSLGKPSINKRVSDFKDQLSQDSLGFFRTLGVNLDTNSTSTTSVNKTYRGQKVIAETQTNPAPKASSDEEPKKKKRIVYRGKVTYV